jgi:hypothetical protein
LNPLAHVARSKSDFNTLGVAIAEGNGRKTTAALAKVLQSLFAYAGFNAIRYAIVTSNIS